MTPKICKTCLFGHKDDKRMFCINDDVRDTHALSLVWGTFAIAALERIRTENSAECGQSGKKWVLAP